MCLWHHLACWLPIKTSWPRKDKIKLEALQEAGNQSMLHDAWLLKASCFLKAVP